MSEKSQVLYTEN